MSEGKIELGSVVQLLTRQGPQMVVAYKVTPPSEMTERMDLHGFALWECFWFDAAGHRQDGVFPEHCLMLCSSTRLH